MTEIRKSQRNLIKKYSEVLDVKKRKNIIIILKLYYNIFSYEYNTSVVDWLENQIIFFLDPYGFNNKYKDKRKLYINNLSKKLEDCEYKNLSLDKIVLYLFTWTNEELKMFYKINKSKNKEKSVYDVGLRILNQKGGGSSNEYVLKYIESLKHINNFKKTILFFNYLDRLNDEDSYYDFIIQNFNIKELYIDINTPFIDINKLFLYLLNIPIKNLDEIIFRIKSFFITFEPKKNFLKHTIKDINMKFTEKEWYYKKYITKINISHKFYKIFDNKLVYANITTTNNNYIRTITFILFDSTKVDYNVKYYYYFYLNLFNKIENKYGLKHNIKTKKIFKIAKKDLFQYFTSLKFN